MTQALQAKQGNRDTIRAGWILDYWVASLIAAMERAIRRRRAKQYDKLRAQSPTSAPSKRNAYGDCDPNS